MKNQRAAIQVMTDADSDRRSWPAYGAALWALIFAGVHIAWAAGWHIGLRAEQAQKAFNQRWFLIYDLVVAAMCVVAVPVALALVRPWGRRLPARLPGLLAWGGTALLVLRSGGSIIQLLYKVLKGSFVANPMYLWEAWFYLGAVLFGVSAWKFSAAQKTFSAEERRTQNIG